jgi:hypothetical protein
MALVDPYAQDALHAASLHSVRKSLMSIQSSEHRRGITNLATSLTTEELHSPGVFEGLHAKHVITKSQFPTPFESELLVERIDRLRDPLTTPPAVPGLPQGPSDRMVFGVTGAG